ncbi:hypothetical protein ACIBCR_15245 [Micromonospora echinospora]|uniref:hypothetical protein n=1 Tax=Micromonospora echinospora TaxID=1877 RepID=UPI0037B5FA7B
MRRWSMRPNPRRRCQPVTHTPNTLSPIPGEPHEPATGWIPPTPKIEIFDYQEPADPDTTQDEQPTKKRRTTIADLKQRLAHARDVAAVKRHDKQLRHVQAVSHRVTMANATEWATTIERARRERTRDATGAAQLAELHRWAASEGERARIRADIERSAEMRALRIASVRRYTMRVGVPVMAGFAAISTPGVQKGMVNLLNLETGSVYWWTAWAVEPLLIAVATSIIVVKSILKRSGGWTDWRADTAKWGALLFSVALNMLGGWNGDGDTMKAAGEALGHSVGALGAAVTAWLIGVIVDYASKAKPWDGVPRLKDLGLVPTVTRDTVTGELVTPSGDTPAVGDADTRQAVTAAVTETPAVTAATPADTDTTSVTADRQPSPSPRPAVTVPAATPTRRHTVTAPIVYKRVTVTQAATSDAVTDTDADAATGDADATVAPSPKPATDVTAAGKVRPLSRDLIDARFRDWTVEQIEEYAAERARAVAAETGNKTAGMREYFLACLALGVDPKGSVMARVVGIKGEGLGRSKAKQWHGELAVADAEQVLRDAHATIAAEVAAGGDGRD